MCQAHFDLYYKDTVFAALIPAEEWLFEWYGKCGYAKQITCTPPPEDVESMDFATFDRWQRAKTCILLHDADAFDVAKEDIRLAGDQYQRPENNVPGMIRVVNVKRALQLYLQQHPETNTVMRLMQAWRISRRMNLRISNWKISNLPNTMVMNINLLTIAVARLLLN